MEKVSKKTVVLGASPKRDRYSNIAVNRLKKNGHEVLPLGFVNKKIGELDIITDFKQFDSIDTVTLYLNPHRQKEHYGYILSLKPKRIIFNPGTENPELLQLAKEQNIETLEACTLVMLSIGNY